MQPCQRPTTVDVLKDQGSGDRVPQPSNWGTTICGLLEQKRTKLFSCAILEEANDKSQWDEEMLKQERSVDHKIQSRASQPDNWASLDDAAM